jgi:hypothetical protein
VRAYPKTFYESENKENESEEGRRDERVAKHLSQFYFLCQTVERKPQNLLQLRLHLRSQKEESKSNSRSPRNFMDIYFSTTRRKEAEAAKHSFKI